MSQAAFALKADRDLDCVGAIVVNTQRTLNVRQLLEENDGTYVTDNAEEITALSAYDPVKRITLTEAQESRQRDNLDDLTKEQLLALPEADGIDGAKSMKVDDLRAAITSARREG